MTNENYSVYAHVNSINGKVYIGITSMTPEQRWANGNGYRSCRHFYKAINKYGWDSFNHIVIIDGLTLEVANLVEIELIKKYSANNPTYGYNITEGGTNGKHSKESKELIRKLRKGQKLSAETKEKIRNANLGEKAYWYGKNRSDETKQKISKARKGTSMPDDVKNRISKTLKGEGCYWYGKHLSDDHKQKLRDKNIGKTIPQEVRDKISNSCMNKNGIEISQYSLEGEFIKTYLSASEASRQVDGDTSSILKCCKKQRRYAYNSQWRFTSEGIECLPPINIKKNKEDSNG